MLDRFVLRPILTFLLKLLFGVEISGLEHYKRAGERLLIVANHQSFLDPLLLAVFLPDKPAFAMNAFQAEKWYFRWVRLFVRLYVIDPLKPMSMKQLIRDLQEGGRIVFFPEGRITTSGSIMKIYEGAGLIAEKTGASLLPIYIDGAQYSKFSNIGHLVRQRWFPKVRMTFLPAWRPSGELPAHAIYDLMVGASFISTRFKRPLLSAVIEAMKCHGGGHKLMSDISRAWMTYRQLFTRAFILREKLRVLLSSPHRGEAGRGASGERSLDSRPHPAPPPMGEGVGVLLPNSLGVAVTFLALHMLGKIPCLLNFSSGAGNMLHGCRIAAARTVLTSRVFIERAEMQEEIKALAKEFHIIYLEDIKPTVSLKDKLRALAQAFIPGIILRDVLSDVHPTDPAVVLYTSGSEGVPKGVALSHANILSNIYQICARVDLNPKDRMFNAMPVFHSFGLTAGMLLPLVQGVQTFLYPTPLHYRIIPDLVYDTDSTILLGTDTFLSGYARYAHPYDFHHIRLAVAGAEKLRETTRRLWADKFQVHILQGYGVTEASPVISVNTPMEHKEGTVGRLLPAIEARLMPVPGLSQGGRLEIKGPNVMLGYLKADKPGVVQPQGEWYDTGDIVDIDGEGFIAILGRAKRFAKIAGEMVSLAAVEELASSASSDFAHAAIAVPDERKGEQIILYTEDANLTRDRLLPSLREQGLPELYMPRQIMFRKTLPRLGNGKIDYLALAKQG